jgi:hypothetical protein
VSNTVAYKVDDFIGDLKKVAEVLDSSVSMVYLKNGSMNLVVKVKMRPLCKEKKDEPGDQ